MTTAPGSVIDQAQHLVKTARLLPADDAAKSLEAAVTVLQAAQADILIDAERCGELKDSGCATVRTFAATILRRSVNDASALARISQHLVEFPQLAKAYRAGEISTGNLRVIVDHLRPCGLDALQANEDQLLDLAKRAGPAEMKQFCERIADLHHPDRDQAKAKALGQRFVKISRVGDLAHVDAMLDPLVADQLKTTLAAMAKASRRRNGTLDGTDANATDGEVEAVAVPSYPERQATALEDIILRGIFAPDLPARGNTTATITVDLETLLAMPGHGQAILSRFGLIPATTARRLSCDALVRLVVTHGDRVLNVGRTQRFVTDRQRAALATLYDTCAMPGCGIRFADCEIHHLWWWSLGGPTDLDLQVPLCRHHHTWLHEHGYTLTRDNGTLVFRDPLGRTITNTDQILTEQLNLLNQQHAQQPPAPPRHQQRHPREAAQRSDIDSWDDWAAQPAFTPPAPPESPTESELDEAATAEARAALENVDGWAANPYRRGAWGWTGPSPAPPPGHAPPTAY